MSTRVISRGRQIYASRDYRPPRSTPLDLNKDGEPINTHAIPAHSPESPFRAGVPYIDPEDEFKLVYRIVQKLDLAEGWGTADFWMRRYHVEFKTLAEWVARGWMDAAIEQGSPTKRYRCRDESKLLTYLDVNPDRNLSRKPSKKPSKKRTTWPF